jgi:hypothetical protein
VQLVASLASNWALYLELGLLLHTHTLKAVKQLSIPRYLALRGGQVGGRTSPG